jgi:hypothetical protein
MTGDMSGVRTRQRKLHFVPERADGPSLSFNYIHTCIIGNAQHFVLGDMSGIRTRQRKLHLVPVRADGPSLSIDYR